jgi:hypothetical protein
MDPRKAELVPLLSSARLEPYLCATSRDLAKAIALYEHNQVLSEALYVPLQNLEVGLRNRLQTLFCREYGLAWFHSGLLRKPPQVRAVADACRKLDLAQKPMESGRVVAELSFGFWTGFFDSSYDQPLWHRYLRDVFPGAPLAQPLSRKLFSGRLEGIRRLRNRVFHHEAILRGNQVERTYADITFVMDFLSPALMDWNRERDRFPRVLGGAFP